jgi:hypothetical protein
VLAHAQEQYRESADYLLQALRIFLQYEDQHNISMVIGNIGVMWQEVKAVQPVVAAHIVAQLAQVRGISPAEAEALLKEFTKDVP